MSQPISIILYGPNDEADKTYIKKVVSWGLLKRAVRLSEAFDADDSDEQAPPKNDWYSRFKRWQHRNDPVISSQEQVMDQISEFVVDVFDGQFTAQQLEDGAEASDIITVLKSIVARAQAMSPTNPPPKPPRKPRHRH